MTPTLPSEAELDRLGELVNIGAGHAATAFGRLVGRTFRMRVPRVRVLRAESAGSTLVGTVHDPEEEMAGIFFTVEGGLGGLVALLIPRAVRDPLLALLVRRRGARASPAQDESALRELGNILASQLVSAIGETLGEAVLPSVPLLTMEDGSAALGALVAHQAQDGQVVRVETQIVDETGDLRALLVLVPELSALPLRHPTAPRSSSATPGTAPL